MPQSTRQDLVERAFIFAKTIFAMYADIARRSAAHAHAAQQLMEASSGIGALLEEGQVANSRRDMAAKYAISLRESRESRFWLRLLSTDPELHDRLAPLLDEAVAFVKMLTVSVRKLRAPEASADER